MFFSAKWYRSCTSSSLDHDSGQLSGCCDRNMVLHTPNHSRECDRAGGWDILHKPDQIILWSAVLGESESKHLSGATFFLFFFGVFQLQTFVDFMGDTHDNLFRRRNLCWASFFQTTKSDINRHSIHGCSTEHSPDKQISGMTKTEMRNILPTAWQLTCANRKCSLARMFLKMVLSVWSVENDVSQWNVPVFPGLFSLRPTGHIWITLRVHYKLHGK